MLLVFAKEYKYAKEKNMASIWEIHISQVKPGLRL